MALQSLQKKNWTSLGCILHLLILYQYYLRLITVWILDWWTLRLTSDLKVLRHSVQKAGPECFEGRSFYNSNQFRQWILQEYSVSDWKWRIWCLEGRWYFNKYLCRSDRVQRQWKSKSDPSTSVRKWYKVLSAFVKSRHSVREWKDMTRVLFLLQE